MLTAPISAERARNRAADEDHQRRQQVWEVLEHRQREARRDHGVEGGQAHEEAEDENRPVDGARHRV